MIWVLATKVDSSLKILPSQLDKNRKSAGFTPATHPTKSIHSFLPCDVCCSYWYWLLRGRRQCHLLVSEFRERTQTLSELLAGPDSPPQKTAHLSFLKRLSLVFYYSCVCFFFFCLFQLILDLPLCLYGCTWKNGLSSHCSETFFEKRKKKQSWISSIARRKKRFLKKDGYFFLPSLFLRHTPMFSFAAQGGEQELARQQGWVSCNWNWCKGLRVVLFSLPDNSSLLHTHTFSRLQMTEMSDCQSVATPWGHPSYL